MTVNLEMKWVLEGPILAMNNPTGNSILPAAGWILWLGHSCTRCCMGRDR